MKFADLFKAVGEGRPVLLKAQFEAPRAHHERTVHGEAVHLTTTQGVQVVVIIFVSGGVMMVVVGTSYLVDAGSLDFVVSLFRNRARALTSRWGWRRPGAPEAKLSQKPQLGQFVVKIDDFWMKRSASS